MPAAQILTTGTAVKRDIGLKWLYWRLLVAHLQRFVYFCMVTVHLKDRIQCMGSPMQKMYMQCTGFSVFIDFVAIIIILITNQLTLCAIHFEMRIWGQSMDTEYSMVW